MEYTQMSLLEEQRDFENYLKKYRKEFVKLTKSDYNKLQKAVTNYNRKVNRILKNNQNAIVPEKISYSELKNNILNKREINRIVNRLENFTKRGSEDIVTLPSGQKVTQWEYNQLKLDIRNIKRRLNKELIELEKPIEGKYSLAQMGSIHVKDIEVHLESIEKVFNLKGYEYKRKRKEIMNEGRSDYILKKDLIYKGNYMYAIEKFASNFENYDLLIEKLNSITNPHSFYEYIQQSRVLRELFAIYKPKGGGYLMGGFLSNEDAFNAGLMELGLL